MTARASILLVTAALVTALCIAPAVGATAGAAAAAGTSGGQVMVSVIIQSRIMSTFDDGGVLVRSNTPWQLSADLPGGERFVVTGDPTSGYYVALPDTAHSVEVCAR